MRRLVGRGTENAAQRERRLATARTELAAASVLEFLRVLALVKVFCWECWRVIVLLM